MKSNLESQHSHQVGKKINYAKNGFGHIKANNQYVLVLTLLSPSLAPYFEKIIQFIRDLIYYLRRVI